MSSAPLNLRTSCSSVWPDISQPPRSSRRSRLQKRPLASKWCTSMSGATSCRGAGRRRKRKKKKRVGRHYFLPERTSFHLDLPSSLHFTSFLSNTHMQKTREKRNHPLKDPFFSTPPSANRKNFLRNYFSPPPQNLTPAVCACVSSPLYHSFYSGF